MIQDKTERTQEEFDELMIILRKRIKTVPNEETEKFIQEAKKFCPDPNDIDYFALALKLKCPIWSNDKVLKTKQKFLTIYSTEDLMKMF